MSERTTKGLKTSRGSLTRKGQVTIPAAMRRQLKLREGDQVSFVLDEDEIRVAPAVSRIASLYGSLRSDRPSLTAEEMRDIADRAIAEEGVRRNS